MSFVLVQWSRYLLGQRFRAYFVLKLAPHMGEGEIMEGVQISKQSSQNLAPCTETLSKLRERGSYIQGKERYDGIPVWTFILLFEEINLNVRPSYGCPRKASSRNLWG